MIDEFLKYEQENNLLNEKWDDFYYWNYIRFFIYRNIEKKTNGFQQDHPNKKNSKIDRIHQLCKFSKYTLVNNPLYNIKQKDVIIINHERKIKNDNNYICMYSGIISSYLKSSYYIFDSPYRNSHILKSGENILFLEYINVISKIKTLYIKICRKYKLNDQQLKKINKILDDLSEIYGVKIDKKYIINELLNMKFKYKIVYKLYLNLLKKIQPKFLFEIVHYKFETMVLNEVCKELNIEVIEIQHGIIGKEHIAYNFLRSEINHFPDKLLCFGDYWTENERIPLKKENIIAMGFPYLENEKERIEDNIYYTDKKYVLFLSQGTIGEKLSIVAKRLSEILPDSYEIIYKLHPSEYEVWEKNYPWLKCVSNIHVVDNNLKSIYYYFSISFTQVGVYSTALLEGLAFNLPTFIMDSNLKYHIQFLLDSEEAKLFKSEDELVNLILEEEEKRINKSVYWQSNSKDNYKNLLKELGI